MENLYHSLSASVEFFQKLPTHKYRDHHQRHVHRARVKEHRPVRRHIQSVLRRPFAHLDDGVRPQFDEVQLEAGAQTLLELDRTGQTLPFDLYIEGFGCCIRVIFWR